MVSKINKNAGYGHYGPGSFWCRRSRRDIMTAAATVDYGRPDPIQMTKRFTCATEGLVVYFLHLRRL